MDVILSLLFAVSLFMSTALGGSTFPGRYDSGSQLGCHIVSYSYNVTQAPQNSGDLPCSGIVTVNACRGFCDTSEIPDHQIPHKISFHRVCTYTGIENRTVVLDNCEVYVIDALDCRCSLCNVDHTSCETLT